MFKVRLTREELQLWHLAPALNDALAGLVEGVFEEQQSDHDAQRHAGAPCVAGRSGTLHLFTEEVQVGHDHTGATPAREELGHPRFDLLPGHAHGQHNKRMTQIDHLIDARTEEIIGGSISKHQNLPKK